MSSYNLTEAMRQADLIRQDEYRIKFNEEHFGENLYEVNLSDYVPMHILPDCPEKYLISTRQIPTCLEIVLGKKVKAYKSSSPDSKKVNKKKIIACAMTWALSKLRSVPEYKALIEEREKKQLEIESADEARLYRNRNSKGLFKRVMNMENLDHPYVLQSDEGLSNQIGELAPTLLMSNYEFALFLLCLGLLYGDKDESHLDEKYRLKQWEKDNLYEIIQITQVYMRTLADEIRHFEYTQRIKGENLFN